MLHRTIKNVLFTVTLACATMALAPTAALAREGAQSVGKGMKCHTVGVLQADGTVKYSRVCYKSI